MMRLNKNIVRFINHPACPIRCEHNNPVPILVAALAAEAEAGAPAVAPVQAVPPMDVEEPEVAEVVKLSACPHSLHELWREYEFGVRGYKVQRISWRRRGVHT